MADEIDDRWRCRSILSCYYKSNIFPLVASSGSSVQTAAWQCLRIHLHFKGRANYNKIQILSIIPRVYETCGKMCYKSVFPRKIKSVLFSSKILHFKNSIWNLFLKKKWIMLIFLLVESVCVFHARAHIYMFPSRHDVDRTAFLPMSWAATLTRLNYSGRRVGVFVKWHISGRAH